VRRRVVKAADQQYGDGAYAHPDSHANTDAKRHAHHTLRGRAGS
jgi:hypothetical protein